MHIIVYGAGVLGVRLAKELSVSKHDVVLIDKDAKTCERVSNEINASVMCGEGSNMDTLKSAGVMEADVVASVTSNEIANILTCLISKKMNPKVMTVARISTPEYEENEKMFKDLGIDMMVYPSIAAGDYLSEVITKPGVVDLAFIEKGDATILEFVVKGDSKLKDRSLDRIKKPRDSVVVALLREHDIVLPEKDMLIREGDRILVLAKNAVIDDVTKIFS